MCTNLFEGNNTSYHCPPSTLNLYTDLGGLKTSTELFWHMQCQPSALFNTMGCRFSLDSADTRRAEPQPRGRQSEMTSLLTGERGEGRWRKTHWFECEPVWVLWASSSQTATQSSGDPVRFLAEKYPWLWRSSNFSDGFHQGPHGGQTLKRGTSPVLAGPTPWWRSTCSSAWSSLSISSLSWTQCPIL